MGEIAAFGTAVFWAISAILFTVGGQRVGAEAVNLVRLYFGFFFIAVVHWFSTGAFFDGSVETWRHGVLLLSAFVGLVIGDGALFYAFVKIGTRLSMLIMSLVPVTSAIFALFCFNEELNIVEWSAIAFSVAAIGYVVGENRHHHSEQVSRKDFIHGILFALVGVLGQTGNLIITKYALVDDFSTLTATKLRIFYSLIMLSGWALMRGQLLIIITKFRDSKALWAIAAGAFVGPFIGIWLSYIAINHTKVAIASVIMATPPLLLIPLSAYFFQEKITARSVIGTVLAFAGIAGLLLSSDTSTVEPNETTQSVLTDVQSADTLGSSTNG